MANAKASHCKNFSHCFNKKYWDIREINLYFKVSLMHDVVSFEQPGPTFYLTAFVLTIANSVDPDKTALGELIGVCTV